MNINVPEFARDHFDRFASHRNATTLRPEPTMTRTKLHNAGRILAACLEYTDVEYADLISDYRHKDLTRAREVVVGALRTFTYMSFPVIAQFMGRRHHATAHDQWQRWCKRDEAEREEILDAIEVGFERLSKSA